MCGRYSIILTAAEIAEVFGLPQPAFATKPRYNLAPTDPAPIIVAEAGAPELVMARFGLIPFWTRGDAPGSGLINARSETVAEKPAFRRAFARSRCLVPADGFYEWQGEKGGRAPHRIVLPNNRPFVFAGLWDTWSAPDGRVIQSFAIVTTDASEDVKPLHHRMPVILDAAGERDTWLHAEDASSLHGLLRPYPGRLSTFAVSRLVNSVANDGPECIEPVSQPDTPIVKRIF